MKKTTLFLTFLMLGLVITARPYAPMADSTYIAPEDTATMTPASPSMAVVSMQACISMPSLLTDR